MEKSTFPLPSCPVIGEDKGGGESDLTIMHLFMYRNPIKKEEE